MSNIIFSKYNDLIKELTLISLLYDLFMLVSCQKDRNLTNRGNEEKSFIKLSVSGIVDDKKVIIKGADKVTSGHTSKDIKIKGANASLKSSKTILSLITTTSNIASDVTSSVKNGKTYCILLQYDEESEFETTAIAKFGEEIEIRATDDQKYTRYAYSYNVSLDITLPDTQKPKTTSPTDRNLFYFLGTPFQALCVQTFMVSFENMHSLRVVYSQQFNSIWELDGIVHASSRILLY